MENSILIPLSNSLISKYILDYFINFGFKEEKQHITLLHIFRKPNAEESLMGKKFVEKQQPRIMSVLEKAKDKLIENGFKKDNIEIKLILEQYQTVSDGIIDQFNKGKYNLVVIGRKRMSKSEEFVLGDISVKLVRALNGTGVMVVKGE